MLGTSGNMLVRGPQMPSARTAPDWTGGRAPVETSMPTRTCPPMRSVIIGAPPRYGTWIILTPAIILNSSPAICEVEPVPYEASVILPGSALASAISSGMVLAGTDGLVTITSGKSTNPAIGAISRTRLKGRESYSEALIAAEDGSHNSVYPSGGELAVCCTETLVAPPGLFSTTTG